jgi:hypothetical protein
MYLDKETTIIIITLPFTVYFAFVLFYIIVLASMDCNYVVNATVSDIRRLNVFNGAGESAKFYCDYTVRWNALHTSWWSWRPGPETTLQEDVIRLVCPDGHDALYIVGAEIEGCYSNAIPGTFHADNLQNNTPILLPRVLQLVVVIPPLFLVMYFVLSAIRKAMK